MKCFHHFSIEKQWYQNNCELVHSAPGSRVLVPVSGISNISLQQCFPTRVPHNIVRGSARNRVINKCKCWNTAKNSKYPSKYRGNFCPVIGNTGVISVRYQPPLCFVLVSSYLRLYLVVFCLCSFRTVTKPPHQWRQKGEPVPNKFSWQ
jgi:hypothetical protein